MDKTKMSAYLQKAKELTQRIRNVARRAGKSELKLQGEVDGYLREALSEFGIDYDPLVNESLRRSYASSGRPDSLFGHVVLDYKAPGVLRTASGLREGKQKLVDEYLKPICTRNGQLDPEEAAKWVGVLLDGRDVLFAIFNGVDNWGWTPVRQVNTYTVLTLIQYYRSLWRKPLDPYLLSHDFGRDSDVAIACIRTFATYLTRPMPRTSMLFKEWRRMFEQVSTYELDQLPALAAWAKRLDIPGRENPSLLLFCLHTYYALIVKLLAAELVTASFGLESFIEGLTHAKNSAEFQAMIERLESGEVFRDLGIINFLEGDFFVWYLLHYDAKLEEVLRQIIDVFRTYEPTTPKLNPRRCRDLLKVFYSHVVDKQIRHDLGEYYTPDWLAELTLNQVGYTGQLDTSLLDPACGSGTFLVLAIQRFLAQAKTSRLKPPEIIRKISVQIKGFDLNPLAVISARANYLLAISEYLSEYGGDLEIPIYLCDCINIPKRKKVNGVPCLVYTLDTELGERQAILPESLVRANVISHVLLQAEQSVMDQQQVETFLGTLHANPVVAPHLGASEKLILQHFYLMIQEFEEHDWDEIWCRIIKNHFASQTIGTVDYIVGNPSWVRWSRLPRRYRHRCKEFCYYYGLVSGRGYAGGIESDISTVMTYSAVNNWLVEGGKIGFLITATVHKSDSARGFRLFELPNHTPIYPQQIDDLVTLLPFPDATNETSLIVARKGRLGEKPEEVYPPSGIPYIVWTRTRGHGRIDPRLTLDEVYTITQRNEQRAVPIAERGSPLYTGSREDINFIQPFRGSSPYLLKAHKGTTTDLARVYWVKVLAYDRTHRRIKIRTLTTEELGGARSENVAFTQGVWIEDGLVYPLIRGRNIGRFCYATDNWYIIIPNRHYERTESEAKFRHRYPLAYRYFRRNRKLLEVRSTYRRYQRHLPFYVIYDVGDYTFSPYKVVWMEQQDPRKFRACVISTYAASKVRHKLIIPDHKLYMLSLDNEDEAHFVCAILNSTHLSRILGGFLVGKQIGTTIFRYVRIPTYNPTDVRHRKIADFSREAHRARQGQRTTDNLPPDKQIRLDRLVQEVF